MDRLSKKILEYEKIVKSRQSQSREQENIAVPKRPQLQIETKPKAMPAQNFSKLMGNLQSPLKTEFENLMKPNESMNSFEIQQLQQNRMVQLMREKLLLEQAVADLTASTTENVNLQVKQKTSLEILQQKLNLNESFMESFKQKSDMKDSELISARNLL